VLFERQLHDDLELAGFEQVPVAGAGDPPGIADDAVELALTAHAPKRFVVFDYHPQVDDQREAVQAANERLAGLGVAIEALGDVIEQGATACCYAKSEKSWIDDPAGIAWETFLTTGESVDYGDGSGERAVRVAHEKQSACCVPQAAPASACCDS